MKTRLREGQYDVRVGSSLYSPIISVFGSLAVPTVIVVLQDGEFAGHVAYEELTLALLIVGILGSVGSGFGYAALAAERDPTANLIPGVMFMAVPASVGLGSVFAAFGIVAHLHLPDVSPLFTVLLALLGCFGVFFTALTLIDAPGVGPRIRNKAGDFTHAINKKWLAKQWVNDRDTAWKKELPLMFAGFATVLVGATVRLVTGWAIEPSLGWTIATVALLGSVSLAALGLTSYRTVHHEKQTGLRPWEAYGATIAIAVLLVFLLFVVP